MNNFKRTNFFILLTVNSQEGANEEMENAYAGFLKEIKILNQSEIDYSNVYRELNLTRIEFVFLRSYIQYEQGEKCLKRSLFTESYFCY